MQNPELALWRSVLFHALADDDAAAWVRSDDFDLVCALAGFEPDAVRRAILAGRVMPLGKKNRTARTDDKFSDMPKMNKKPAEAGSC